MPYFPLVSVTFRRCPVTYGYAVLRSRLECAPIGISSREEKAHRTTLATSARSIVNIEAEATLQ
jgi:hypothetical protein